LNFISIFLVWPRVGEHIDYLMRTMITANTVALKKVFDHYHQVSGSAPRPGKPKYISTDDTEKKWLQELKITNDLSLSSDFSAVGIEFDGKNFAATWGRVFDENCCDLTVLQPLPMNAGILTVLLSETSINLDENFGILAFEEQVSAQHQAADFKGYQFEDLLPFLPPLHLFELPAGSPFLSSDLFRISCYLFLINERLIPLPYDKATIEALLKLTLEEEGVLSFENVYYGVTSANWRHSFLEFYRCVERLYPIKFLSRLYADLNVPSTFLDFVKKIEEATGWRPKEEDAIKTLLEDITSDIQDLYIEFLKTTGEATPPAIYTYLYKLRNAIVHFRANSSNVSLTIIQWNYLIRLKSDIIKHFYKLYKSNLVS
jgi:hypothetical protein